MTSGGYKIVIRKLGACLPPSVMAEVVNALFPVHSARAERVFGGVCEFEPFQEEELYVAVRSLKNKKAPGCDGILPKC